MSFVTEVSFRHVDEKGISNGMRKRLPEYLFKRMGKCQTHMASVALNSTGHCKLSPSTCQQW
jgi:hypothetical protein